MTDQLTEPAVDEAVDIVFTDEDAARMRELDAAIAAQGGVGPEDDTATRGGFGSAATMIAEARKHLGYHEEPGNVTIFNKWLGPIGGTFGYFWCHSFQSYCLAHSDNAGAGPITAGCSVGLQWFIDRGRLSQTPHVGDLVYYGTTQLPTHIELVVAVSPTAIQTIGGNTSGQDASGVAFNGDGVYIKWVNRSGKIAGYGSPMYSVDDTDVPTGGGGRAAAGGAEALVTPMTSVRTIKQQQVAANHVGFRPQLIPNDEWSARTQAGVMFLQTKIGVTADGQWGNDTETAFKAWKAANG
jgi:hypothetical protein